jgi:hypothetical protein
MTTRRYRRSLATVLLAAFLVQACSSTHRVAQPEPGDRVREIELASGDIVHLSGQQVALVSDSVVVVRRAHSDSVVHRIPMRDVTGATIRRFDAGRTAIAVIGVGVVAFFVFVNLGMNDISEEICGSCQ